MKAGEAVYSENDDMDGVDWKAGVARRNSSLGTEIVLRDTRMA